MKIFDEIIYKGEKNIIVFFIPKMTWDKKEKKWKEQMIEDSVYLSPINKIVSKKELKKES